MNVRTCLLISDDPDDHIEISEALYDVSDDIVVVTVSNFVKALDLMLLKRYVPEFIVLNTGIADFEADRFFAVLDGEAVFAAVRVIVFGESLSPTPRRVAFTLGNELSFSELKEQLRRAVDLNNG